MKDNMYALLAMRTPWEDTYKPGTIPTITTNAKVTHCQQANETYVEARQIIENTATVDEALNHQIIKTI